MEMQLALTPTEVTTVPATLVIKVPVIQDFVKTYVNAATTQVYVTEMRLAPTTSVPTRAPVTAGTAE